MFSKPRLRVNIVSMGSAACGKSCLVRRFRQQRCRPHYLPTLGADHSTLSVDVRRTCVSVNVADLSGNPLLLEMHQSHLRDSHGAVLVFDVTDRSSFLALDRWLGELAGATAGRLPVVVVCANKVDRADHAVKRSEGQRWAAQHRFPYFETSAVLDYGVRDAFQKLLTTVLEKKKAMSWTLSSSGSDSVPSLSEAKADSRKEARSKVKGEGWRCREDVTTCIQRLLMSHDDYHRLGVTRTSSVSAVNRQYRRLALLLHPDRTQTPGAEDAFKQVAAARDRVLKDLARRDALALYIASCQSK